MDNSFVLKEQGHFCACVCNSHAKQSFKLSVPQIGGEFSTEFETLRFFLLFKGGESFAHCGQQPCELERMTLFIFVTTLQTSNCKITIHLSMHGLELKCSCFKTNWHKCHGNNVLRGFNFFRYTHVDMNLEAQRRKCRWVDEHFSKHAHWLSAEHAH